MVIDLKNMRMVYFCIRVLLTMTMMMNKTGFQLILRYLKVFELF